MTKNIVRYWLPLYAYGAFIFYMSSLSHPLPRISIPYFDKFLHMVEYAIFGILAARAFKNSSQEVFYKNFKILAVLAAVAYGASDELHQAFVSCRDCNILDLAADLIGGTVGAVFYNLRQSKLTSYIHEL